MNKEIIPTAEELFKEYSSLYQFEEGDSEYLTDKDDFKTALIEFAKLHCEAQAKEIVVKAELLDNKECWRSCSCDRPCKMINEDSILNAYPLSNIK